MPATIAKIPNGMSYHFGTEASARRELEQRVMRVFADHGYEEISTPTLDYYALFERGIGAHAAAHAFRFSDEAGDTLALRPDVTSQIARAAATVFATRPRPVRLCYAANIFRAQARAVAGWRRETRQLGCELIGADDARGDAEIVLLAAAVMRALCPQKTFLITLSDAEILNGIVNGLTREPTETPKGGSNSQDIQDVDDTTMDKRLIALIDKRDRQGAGKLLENAKVDAPRREALFRLMHLSGKQDALQQLGELVGNERSLRALSRLKELWRAIEAAGLTDCFRFDFGEVPQLDYYTGVIFKIYVEGIGARVGSGGRYDALAANFNRREASTGFAIELDTLAEKFRDAQQEKM